MQEGIHTWRKDIEKTTLLFSGIYIVIVSRDFHSAVCARPLCAPLYRRCTGGNSSLFSCEDISAGGMQMAAHDYFSVCYGGGDSAIL